MYEIPVVFVLVGIFSELYLVSLYMGFLPGETFGGIEKLIKENEGVLFLPCLAGAIFKNVINTIEMKQGMFRIIDFDVEEKNMKIN